MLKDTCCGPDPCQWNLDVLSREPSLLGPGRVWFPGHPEFGMGLEVTMVEPVATQIAFVPGQVHEKLLTPAGRATLKVKAMDWTVTEHWLMRAPAGPGETFVALLFPRRPEEAAPEVDYLVREESLRIRHGEGQDLVFLRPNPGLQISLDGVVFAGRAGIARDLGSGYALHPLDAERMAPAEQAARIVFI